MRWPAAASWARGRSRPSCCSSASSSPTASATPACGRTSGSASRARNANAHAYVEVCDAGRSGRVPVKREQRDALEPGGLGLVLVDEMADRWGVHCHADETCVWFELACEA